MTEWLNISVSEILGIGISTFLIYVALIAFVRINGLRSFAKIAAYDFAITVAIGSIIASTVTAEEPTLLQGALAVLALLLWKKLISFLRLHGVQGRFENAPVLLMRNGEILENNLEAVRMTKMDLYSKLREASISNFDQVRAVVFETTGDVSVMQGKEEEFDDELLKFVNKDVKSGGGNSG